MQVVSRPAPPSESLEVPFVDLRPSHDGVVSGVIDEIATVIETGSFTNGPQVEEFERGYAEYCGVDHCVGTSSGLDALRLGLMALDIKRGDEVIVPANTFIATFEAVAQVGAAPVPADVSTGDMNLDPVAVEAAITSRTRAIVPVHLYGQLADMRALLALSDKHDIPIVEDACQAHGAARNGLVAGAGGAAAAFSFYPAKNLGAFGDAGALTTNDPGIAESVRQLREHGQREKYRHVSIGYTARLDTIQAVVLRHKLPLLDGWNEDRRSIASRYADELVEIGDLEVPPAIPGNNPVWHLYVIRTKRRDDLASFLRARGVGVGLHYPEPPHLSVAFAHLEYPAGAFPVSEALANEVLSLPIYPGMSPTQVATVCDGVRRFFAGG